MKNFLRIATAVISTCACMGSTVPLACNLKAFTPQERQEWRAGLDRFHSAVTSTRELKDGYEFHVDPARASLAQVAAWIELERKCCPFFDYRLDVQGGNGSLSVSLTGGEGVKEFIRLDFSLDNQRN